MHTNQCCGSENFCFGSGQSKFRFRIQNLDSSLVSNLDSQVTKIIINSISCTEVPVPHFKRTSFFNSIFSTVHMDTLGPLISLLTPSVLSVLFKGTD